MKSILLSIKTKWVAKIFNGEKTIEIRKKFPKDYVGWVYIYCTKEDDLCCIKKIAKDKYVCGKDFDISDFNYLASGYNGKGKVVARFWCDKVEEIKTTERHSPELLDQSCLNADEFYDYLTKGKNFLGKILGYAIHISNLEIFDRPRELSEFYKKGYLDYIKPCEHPRYPKTYKDFYKSVLKVAKHKFKITKAPQSWCYCEVGE